MRYDIIIAGALIGLGIGVGLVVAADQDRYRLVAAGNPGGERRVAWRIDRATGRVDLCYAEVKYGEERAHCLDGFY